MVTLDDIPHLLRWIDLSERTGHMTEDEAWEWRLKLITWKSWLELEDERVR